MTNKSVSLEEEKSIKVLQVRRIKPKTQYLALVEDGLDERKGVRANGSLEMCSGLKVKQLGASLKENLFFLQMGHLWSLRRSRLSWEWMTASHC